MNETRWDPERKPKIVETVILNEAADEADGETDGEAVGEAIGEAVGIADGVSVQGTPAEITMTLLSTRVELTIGSTK